MSNQSIEASRNLLNSKDFGVLSTISLKLGGFPFGSVVPYCLDELGRIVVLISSIAEHTKNITADSRTSITVIQDDEDVQSNGRLCIIGNMEKIEADTIIAERYYRYFPKSRGYHGTHNFSFYHLVPTDIRYIGGFGAIHWLNAIDFQITNPFHGTDEERIVAHMNEDHQKDLIAYCKNYKDLTISPDDEVQMVGIDGNGFDVYINSKKIRFLFEHAINSTQEAREQMVLLSKGLK